MSENSEFKNGWESTGFKPALNNKSTDWSDEVLAQLKNGWHVVCRYCFSSDEWVEVWSGETVPEKRILMWKPIEHLPWR